MSHVVLTPSAMTIIFFWGVMPSSLVDTYLSTKLNGALFKKTVIYMLLDFCVNIILIFTVTKLEVGAHPEILMSHKM